MRCSTTCSDGFLRHPEERLANLSHKNLHSSSCRSLACSLQDRCKYVHVRFPRSHAPAWERIRFINHPDPADPPSGTAAGYALAAPSPPQGGEICFSLFPCSGVGTRNGQRNVCIPTQERGNERFSAALVARSGRPLLDCVFMLTSQHSFDLAYSLVPTLPRGNAYGSSITLTLLIPPLALLRATPLPRLLPLRGERFASPCSHAPAWEQETVSVMYAFPRRSVGTRDSALLWLPAQAARSLTAFSC